MWPRGRSPASPRARSSRTRASITAAITTSAPRAVAPSSTFKATPRPRSGSAAQYTPSAPTLQKTRSPSCAITRLSMLGRSLVQDLEVLALDLIEQRAAGLGLGQAQLLNPLA